jgi:tetratricopeptide (TPR) repeat protein
MYRDIGDNNNFLNDFNRVLEINPNRSYAYIYMASTKLKQGDFNSALGLINKSIELNPNEPTAHYTKGRILFISKDYKGCKLSLDKAISLNPLDSDFYLIRALAEAGLGENENCCLDFKKAIELGNEDAIKFDKELNVQEYCDKKDNTNDYLTKQFYLGILDGMKNYNNNSSTSSVSTNNSVQGNSSNVTNSNSTSSPQKTEPFEFEVTVKWSSPTNNVAKCGLNLTVENGVLGMGPNYESNSCGFSVDPVCPKCKKKLLNVSSCNGFAYQNPHKSFEKFKVRCPNCSY